MATRLFRSSDPGAPILYGGSGALIALLDACLVGTGGLAYGTGPTVKAAAGWTRAFASGDIVAYRNSLADGGLGCYLRVDDTDPQVARVVVYRTMTDLNTGTDPAPSTSQQSGGAYWHKSTAADAAARGWCLVADSRSCYGVVLTNQSTWATSTTRYSTLFGAGDIASHVPGDAFGAFCIGAHNASPTAQQSTLQQNTTWFTSGAFSYFGFALARDHVGNAGAIAAGIAGPGSGSGLSTNAPYPAPGSNLAFVLPAQVTEPVCGLRGRLRGAYALVNQTSGSGIGNNATLLLDPTGAPMVELTIFAGGAGATNGCLMVATGTWT